MAQNNLLAYPYFNKRFEIHTDDRNVYLGEVIGKEVNPIDLYSRKPTGSLKRHT